MSGEVGLRQAADWIIATGYVVDWNSDMHPPADLWEAIVDAVHADPTGSLHGGALSREEVDAWLRFETGRPDDVAGKEASSDDRI